MATTAKLTRQATMRKSQLAQVKEAGYDALVKRRQHEVMEREEARVRRAMRPNKLALAMAMATHSI